MGGWRGGYEIARKKEGLNAWGRSTCTQPACKQVGSSQFLNLKISQCFHRIVMRNPHFCAKEFVARIREASGECSVHLPETSFFSCPVHHPFSPPHSNSPSARYHESLLHSNSSRKQRSAYHRRGKFRTRLCLVLRKGIRVLHR